MAREIPSGAVEIQTGLWLYTYNKTISGTEYTFRQLFSSEGYCFYENNVPEENRIYYQWMSLSIDYSSMSYDEINADFTSIPISELPEGSDIAGTKPEIA